MQLFTELRRLDLLKYFYFKSLSSITVFLINKKFTEVKFNKTNRLEFYNCQRCTLFITFILTDYLIFRFCIHIIFWNKFIMFDFSLRYPVDLSNFYTNFKNCICFETITWFQIITSSFSKLTFSSFHSDSIWEQLAKNSKLFLHN